MHPDAAKETFVEKARPGDLPYTARRERPPPHTHTHNMQLCEEVASTTDAANSVG